MHTVMYHVGDLYFINKKKLGSFLKGDITLFNHQGHVVLVISILKPLIFPA